MHLHSWLNTFSLSVRHGLNRSSRCLDFLEDDYRGDLIRVDDNGGDNADTNLSGTLRLMLVDDLDDPELHTLSGTSFHICDWTNAYVTG